MDGDIHMYDVVGSRREEGQKLHVHVSNETERINDRQEYMSLVRGQQQEEASEYQQPQWNARKIKTAAVSNDEAKESVDCRVLKDELKQTKICICVLIVLIVILFLITASSLGLAAYGFSSIRNFNHLEYQLNMISSKLVSQGTSVANLESQLNTISASQITSIKNLESQLNTTDTEVIFQRTFVDTQLNGIYSDVSTVRNLVTSLENQLNTLLINVNVSSVQIALRSQPRK